MTMPNCLAVKTSASWVRIPSERPKTEGFSRDFLRWVLMEQEGVADDSGCGFGDIVESLCYFVFQCVPFTHYHLYTVVRPLGVPAEQM